MLQEKHKITHLVCKVLVCFVLLIQPRTWVTYKELNQNELICVFGKKYS